MSADIKINRIKSQNKVYMDILDDVIHSEELKARVPRLGEVAEARQAHKNRVDTIRELNKYKGSNLHYVANVDVSIWAAVLEVFARHDPETNELMDDGLLYKWDVDKGCLVLNRDFF